VVAAVALVASALVSACTSPGSARPAAVSTSDVPPRPFHVAVLGDSYSSGNGAGHYTKPAACFRSPLDYGGRFVRALNRGAFHVRATFTDLACSGAVTADVIGRGPLHRAAQVRRLPRNTNLVFLTIGGNDGGFATIAATCLVGPSLAGILGTTPADCAHALGTAESLVHGGASSTLGHRLRAVLTAIHRRARAARIVLLGYPYLINSRTYRYGPVRVGRRLYALQNAADRVGAAVTARLDRGAPARYAFVSTHRLFRGHGLDPGTSTTPGSWLVAPFSTLVAATWYHPRPVGWAAEAALLVRDAARFGV